MIQLAQTSRGDFPVRVVVGRIVSVAEQPAPPAAHTDRLTGLACTHLVIEHDDLVRELALVHLQPLDIVPHRSLTIVTGCEVEREWPLYIYSPSDKNHRRFDEHIGWFLGSQGEAPLSEADQRVIWSAILLQVLPGGTR
ncbi:hypothetical protein ASE11_24275 [Hydrogenophaga sp. Root209]|uniref:hypothetical protein n=1 Tax=Hydrogenophaga sp. Root209 TaxID=1736490 RepID=UPI000700C438|nr:hypothetical protein [Hydrogenophaga sp. Root209]KRC05195.1 hypothetical protein ASE11_24275 [Hydrogenophaga sp. Root209]